MGEGGSFGRLDMSNRFSSNNHISFLCSHSYMQIKQIGIKHKVLHEENKTKFGEKKFLRL